MFVKDVITYLPYDGLCMSMKIHLDDINFEYFIASCIAAFFAQLYLEVLLWDLQVSPGVTIQRRNNGI